MKIIETWTEAQVVSDDGNKYIRRQYGSGNYVWKWEISGTYVHNTPLTIRLEAEYQKEVNRK